MVTPDAKRKTVKHLQEHFGQSRRRICKVVGLSPSTWHYRLKPDDNPTIRERLRELAGERRRWGYRKMHEILRREGIIINHKRTEKLYREECLQLKTRRRKKTTATLRVPLPYPENMNQRWAMDFSVPQKSGMRDEGSPLAIGLQEQVANHRKQHWSKASVVSVTEKVL